MRLTPAAGRAFLARSARPAIGVAPDQAAAVDPVRPLRVGLLVPYDLAPQAGGVRQHAFHLKRALEHLGDHVALFGPTTGEPTEHLVRPPDGVYAFRGVVTVPVNGTRSHVGMLVSPRALLRACRAENLDVLHLHEPQVPTMAWGLCWRLAQVPKVATFHAADETDSIPLLRRISGAMVYRFIDRGIAVSPACEARTLQTWPRPLAVIPNGVCTDLFVPAGPADERPPGPPRFLFVGALADARKGARSMLAAFARLRASGVEAELTMVGAQRGFDLGEAPPGVHFLEGLSNEELAQAYRRCDALVAPAMGRESFGMILLEAMASAKPVLYSDIVGYRAVVAPDGAMGFPPGDVPALCAGMAALVALPEDRRKAMGAANHAHAQQYAWAHVAQRVRQEYFAAMAQRRPTARAPSVGAPMGAR